MAAVGTEEAKHGRRKPIEKSRHLGAHSTAPGMHATRSTSQDAPVPSLHHDSLAAVATVSGGLRLLAQSVGHVWH
jgi:hypothetical protein